MAYPMDTVRVGEKYREPIQEVLYRFPAPLPSHTAGLHEELLPCVLTSPVGCVRSALAPILGRSSVQRTSHTSRRSSGWRSDWHPPQDGLILLSVTVAPPTEPVRLRSPTSRLILRTGFWRRALTTLAT